jgi:hypothetical protein
MRAGTASPCWASVLDEGLPAPESDVDVEGVFGHAHAAAGLLRLAAGLLRSEDGPSRFSRRVSA